MGSEFERIYETYYMKVYSYVLSRCRDPHTAEEITQKTFYRALTARQPFRAESSLFSWLCSIAKNALIDEIRVAKRKVELNEEPGSEDDPAHGVELQDQIVQIHEILHAMEEPYKEVFSLRVFGELPFGPIGRLFGKSENWARVTFYRARLKSRKGWERMKTDCGIIADLLPLYTDGVCSPESVKMIEEHLLECENCARQVRVMKQDQPVEAIAADSRRILRRHRRRGWKRVTAGVLAGILLATGTFAFMIRYVGPPLHDYLLRGTAAYVVVTIGPSDDFTQEEIEAAVRVVRSHFDMLRSVLLTIEYEEEYSRYWGATMHRNDKVLALSSTIFVSSGNGGASPGTVIKGWCWYLVKDAESGKWTLIAQGMA